MADEALRLNAVVTDHFTGPLQNLKNQVTNVARSPALASMRKDWGNLTREITGGAKALQSSFFPALSGINPVALGAAGSVTALIAAMKGMTASAVQLGVFRRSVEITPSKFKEMKLLGELFGQSSEQTQQGIHGLHRTIDELKNTYGSAFTDLVKLDLPRKSIVALGAAKSMSEAIDMAIDMIRREPNKENQRKIAEALKWPGLEIIARESSQEIQNAVKEIAQKTTDLSEEAALKFRLNMMRLSDSAENLTKRALAPMIPVLNQILVAVAPKIETVFTQIANDIPKILDGLKELKAFWDKGDYLGIIKKIDDSTKLHTEYVKPGGPLASPGNEPKRAEWIEKRLDVLAKRKEQHGSLDEDAEEKKLTEELKKLREFLEHQRQTSGAQSQPADGTKALPHFQSGGVVPGPKGKSRTIVAHGGEQVGGLGVVSGPEGRPQVLAARGGDIVLPKFVATGQQRALLDAISVAEGSPRWDQLTGVKGNTARGFYQINDPTLGDFAPKVGASPKDVRADPERYGKQAEVAWRIAAQEYRKKVGGNLDAALTSGKHREIATSLRKKWSSLPGASQQWMESQKFWDALVDAREKHGVGGGRRGREPDLPSFQDGGVVPGSSGELQPIIAHGGEIVVPGNLVDRRRKLFEARFPGNKDSPSTKLLRDQEFLNSQGPLMRLGKGAGEYNPRFPKLKMTEQQLTERLLKKLEFQRSFRTKTPVLTEPDPVLKDLDAAMDEPGDLLKRNAALNKPQSLDARGSVNVNLHGRLRDKNAKVNMDGMFQKVNVNRGKSMPAPDAPPI